LGVAFVEKIHHQRLLGLLALSAGTMRTQTIVVAELGCSFQEPPRDLADWLPGRVAAFRASR
jgi:hypothetical protein